MNFLRNVILHGLFVTYFYFHVGSPKPTGNPSLPKFFLAENWTSSRPGILWTNFSATLKYNKMPVRFDASTKLQWNWDRYVRYVCIYDMVKGAYLICIYISYIYKYHVPVHLLMACLYENGDGTVELWKTFPKWKAAPSNNTLQIHITLVMHSKT